MNKLATVLVVAALPLLANAQAEFPAPFGLTWDMSVSELKAVGFSHTTDSDGFAMYSSVSVPKAWSKAETYLAMVYKGRLVKVAAVSTDFTGDTYGSEGKKVYGQMKALLTKKYGAPDTSLERIGIKLYDEADEFYQCLEYSGCGYYTSIFSYAGGTIGVQLKGKRRGEGYITIGYESPQFESASAAIERGEESEDEDAL